MSRPSPPLDYAAPAVGADRATTSARFVFLCILPPILLWLTPAMLASTAWLGGRLSPVIGVGGALLAFAAWIVSMAAFFGMVRLLREGHRSRSFWVAAALNLPSILLPFALAALLIVAVLTGGR